MMKRYFSLTALAAAAVAMFAFGGGAQAEPFSVLQDDAATGFECGTIEDGADGDNDLVGCGGTVNDHIEWRINNNPRSSLDIFELASDDPDPGDVAGPLVLTDDFQDVSEIRHTSIVIPGGVFNFDAIILSEFTLEDEGNGLPIGIDGSDSIPISFTETANSNCPPPNPVGSTCDDFFTFEVSDFADIPFTDADGNDWLLQFNLRAGDGVVVLPGPGPNGGTVFTAEREISSLFVQARVVPVRVPEPTMLLLLGTVLFGLGAVRRRYL